MQVMGYITKWLDGMKRNRLADSDVMLKMQFALWGSAAKRKLAILEEINCNSIKTASTISSFRHEKDFLFYFQFLN